MRCRVRLISLTVIAITLPLLIQAATCFGAYVNQLPQTAITTKGFQGVVDYTNLLRNWLFGIFLAVAVVFLIYSAFLFLTSGGDEERVKKAKKYLFYTAGAVAIGILSASIVVLVGSFFDTFDKSQSPDNNFPIQCTGLGEGQCPNGYICQNGECVNGFLPPDNYPKA